MKLGKTLGRIGFIIGFLGPVLFYASPPTLFTYESHVVCPLCPYVDIAFATRLTWIEVGLEVGLLFGLVSALVGFVIGYLISKVRHRHAPKGLNEGQLPQRQS